MIEPVFGQDEIVARWIADRVRDANYIPETKAIGVARDRQLIAGVGYYNMTTCDIRMVVAAEPGSRWLSKSMLEIFFGYVFYAPPLGLGLRRATAIIHRKNKKSREFNRKIGWVEEGCHKHAFPDGDAISYGMIAEDCRWIKHELRERQPSTRAA